VDPLSHLAFGKTLHALDQRGRLGPHTLGPFLIGSVLPDIDSVLFAFGPDVYLRYHDTGTHSVGGTATGALVVAAIWRRFFPASRPLPVFLAAWMGALGHVFWDVVSGADIHAFAPLLSVRLRWHLVAMADPYVMALLVAGTAAGWWWSAHRRRWAVATLAVIALFLATKQLLHDSALSAYLRPSSRGEVVESQIEPVWGTVTAWRVYDRTPSELRVWAVDNRSGACRLLFSQPAPPLAGVVAASRRLPIVRNFLVQATMPFAQLLHSGRDEEVLWSELRWCSDDGRDCGLAFGGMFDERRNPLYQVIRFGSHTTVRALPAGAR